MGSASPGTTYVDLYIQQNFQFYGAATFPFTQTELRFHWNWSFTSDPNALFVHTELKPITFDFWRRNKQGIVPSGVEAKKSQNTTILFCYFPWSQSPGTFQPAGCQISSDLYLFHTQKQKGFKANNLLNVISNCFCVNPIWQAELLTISCDGESSSIVLHNCAKKFHTSQWGSQCLYKLRGVIYGWATTESESQAIAVRIHTCEKFLNCGCMDHVILSAGAKQLQTHCTNGLICLLLDSWIPANIPALSLSNLSCACFLCIFRVTCKCTCTPFIAEEICEQYQLLRNFWFAILKTLHHVILSLECLDYFEVKRTAEIF